MSSITAVLAPITDELQLVHREIRMQLQAITGEYRFSGGIHSYFQEVMQHLFKNQGKLLRPALVIFSSYLCGGVLPGQREALVRLAAAVELIHSASLVHDDIIDKSEFRRNQLSLGCEFGNTTAVLAGDILYAQFFNIITELAVKPETKRQQIYRLFCRTTKQMCFGEIWEDHLLAGGRAPSFGDYIKILEHKTAVLMAAACRCGAIFSGADPGTVTTLGEFGLNFGIAYQLADDYIDRDSLLRGNVDILEQCGIYICKAQDSLDRDFLSGSQRKWKKQLVEFCDFIREYAQSGDLAEGNLAG